jgi:CheY-like chemotaxis protein
VLIIEDDVELSEIFAFALGGANLRTEVVRDGGVALERITATQPDLIMLDMHLPNVSGAEILTQLRADPRWVGMKVVIVTADALVARANEAQADMVLLKPVSFDQLIKLPQRLLSGV